jgi:hypothetical protein
MKLAQGKRHYTVQQDKTRNELHDLKEEPRHAAKGKLNSTESEAFMGGWIMGLKHNLSANALRDKLHQKVRRSRASTITDQHKRYESR